MRAAGSSTPTVCVLQVRCFKQQQQQQQPTGVLSGHPSSLICQLFVVPPSDWGFRVLRVVLSFFVCASLGLVVFPHAGFSLKAHPRPIYGVAT